MTFEEYCLEKYGKILTETSKLTFWSEEDCLAVSKHSYTESDREYDKLHLGLTDAQIFNKAVERGADSLWDNEIELWSEEHC